MSDADREQKIARGCMNTLGFLLFAGILAFNWFGSGVGNSNEDVSSGDLRWERYDVTIDIGRDGTVHVTEYQEVFFDGSFREGYAAIPMERIEGISNVEVWTEGRPPDTDGDGYLTDAEAQLDGPLIPAERVETMFLLEPHTFVLEDTGSEFLIDYAFESTGTGRPYGYVEQVRTIILEYDVEGVIRDYPDAEEPWQQVHWMAISSDVLDIAPIETSTVTIVLPESVPVETLAFAPEPDAVEGDRLVWTRANLNEGDSIDVQVAFPAITDAQSPSWQAAADARDDAAQRTENRRALAGVMLIGATILTAVAGGLGILYAWYTRVRDVVPGVVSDRLSEPPDDLPGALVGTLIDEEVHPRDVAAAVMDLQRRAVVRIAQTQEHAGYTIELVDAGADLPSYERLIVDGIFGAHAAPGTMRDFTALRTLFGESREAILRAMEQELVDRGYLAETPSTSRTRWVASLRAFVVITLVAAGGLLLWTRAWTWWALLPPAVGIIVYVAGKRLTPSITRKTPLGAEVSARWVAFQRHLQTVQWEFFSNPNRTLNEQYLPWVIAFGMDHHWLSRMNAGGPVAGAGSASVPTSPGRAWGRVDGPAGRTGAGGSARRVWTPTTPSWGWDPGSWGDMQGASDSVLSKLGSGSESMFSMLGDAMAAMGESGGSGGGSGGSRSGGSWRSSRSGGGRSRSSSGGGRRGFR